MNRRTRSSRAHSRRGTASLEEIMALAVVLPLVATATFLGLRLFRIFCAGVTVGGGWPFP